MGRPAIHKSGPMTATEHQRRWREKVRKRNLLAGQRDRAALRHSAGDAGDKDLWSTPPDLIAALLQYVLPTLPPDIEDLP